MQQFTKRRVGAPAAYFRCEAAGLRWLAAAGGADVVAVREVGTAHLVLHRLTTTTPTPSMATAFGAALASTHAAGAPGYGSPPPEVADLDSGFIADLPLPYGGWPGFGMFYAQARIEPYLALLGGPVRPVFAELCEALIHGAHPLTGPPEPASRLHGDLWSGNVVWTPEGAVLIDPAAHGGHRETDLAMLALFGAPHLHAILEAYDSAWPLASGWRDRVPLHQVHPLLVHAVLFGGAYLAQAEAAARAALRLL